MSVNNLTLTLDTFEMTKPKSDRSTFIWCDYCNASIRADGIKACLRKTCEHKGLV